MDLYVICIVLKCFFLLLKNRSKCNFIVVKVKCEFSLYNIKENIKYQCFLQQ